MVAEGDSSVGEDKKDGELEVRRWGAVCGHFHHGKVRVLGSMVVASERSVGLDDGSCVDVVRRLAACAAVEADHMLRVFPA